MELSGVGEQSLPWGGSLGSTPGGGSEGRGRGRGKGQAEVQPTTASADPSEKPWSFDPPLSIFLTWTAMARSLHSVSSWMWAMGGKEGSWAGFPLQLRLP